MLIQANQITVLKDEIAKSLALKLNSLVFSTPMPFCKINETKALAPCNVGLPGIIKLSVLPHHFS